METNFKHFIALNEGQKILSVLGIIGCLTRRSTLPVTMKQILMAFAIYAIYVVIQEARFGRSMHLDDTISNKYAEQEFKKGGTKTISNESKTNYADIDKKLQLRPQDKKSATIFIVLFAISATFGILFLVAVISFVVVITSHGSFSSDANSENSELHKSRKHGLN